MLLDQEVDLYSSDAVRVQEYLVVSSVGKSSWVSWLSAIVEVDDKKPPRRDLMLLIKRLIMYSSY